MNTNESRSVETEEIKREQNDTRAASGIWLPFEPDVKQDQKPLQPVKEPRPVIQQEPVQQFPNDLSFACVLIPRFSDHYLVGDIVDCLSVWMKQACISFGWRLEAIAVRPGYIQWVMRVPLNANPAQFMRIIRRHTSEKIFEDFPRFKQKNISGEFWAQGNFVTPGSQLQPPDQVNEYILQTRRNQGIV